jgi:hypothetical protein
MERTCDDCGVCSEDVEYTIDPYIDEIYDEEEWCNLCPDCYHERCQDI